MVATTCFGNEIIIGFNNKVAFIENSNILKKTISLPDKIFINEIKNSAIQNKNVKENEDKSSEDEIKSSTIATPRVRHVVISPSGDYIAVTTSGQKSLLLYKLIENNVDLVSCRRIVRVTSAVTFSNDSTKILLCDKAGDCYMFSCIDFSSPGIWILGHLSAIFDIILSPNEDFVITCDRDEKIRVTKFPNTHEIECYCLGHREYVSSINLLSINPDEYLLSLSGDSTLRIWKYKIGEQVSEINLPAAGIKMSIQKITDSMCRVAVLLYEAVDSILIYEIKISNSTFESCLTRKYSPDLSTVTNLCCNLENFYVILSNEKQFELDVIPMGQCNDFSKIKSIVKELFKNEPLEIEDVSSWFKKKFDNISEYLERKKRRIEKDSTTG